MNSTSLPVPCISFLLIAALLGFYAMRAPSILAQSQAILPHAPTPVYAPCLVENWPSVSKLASPALSLIVARACQACPGTSPIESKLCVIQRLSEESSADWRDFIAAVEKHVQVHAIIGTRDRAAALFVTLSLWQPPRAGNMHITVLFSASNAQQRNAYVALEHDFPTVTFLERHAEGDFFSLLSSTVSTTSASHILLLADDTLLRLPTNFARIGGIMDLLNVPNSFNAACGTYLDCFGEGLFIPRTSISHLGIAQYNDVYKDTHESAEGWHDVMRETASTFGSGDDHLYAVRLAGAEFSGLQPTMLIANTSACPPYLAGGRIVLMCYTRPIDGSFTSKADLLQELLALAVKPSNPGELEGHLTNNQNNFASLGYYEEYTLFFPEQIVFNINDFHASMSVRSSESPPILQEFALTFSAGCRQHVPQAQLFMEWVASREPGCKWAYSAFYPCRYFSCHFNPPTPHHSHMHNTGHRGGFPIPWTCPKGVLPPVSQCPLAAILNQTTGIWTEC